MCGRDNIFFSLYDDELYVGRMLQQYHVIEQFAKRSIHAAELFHDLSIAVKRLSNVEQDIVLSQKTKSELYLPSVRKVMQFLVS